MKEHVLITGGAGFIGSHLADALLEEGHKVRIIDSLEPQVHGASGEKPDYLNPGAEFVHGNIRDFDLVSLCLEGIDVIFHLAAIVGVNQSMYDICRYTNNNVGGTATLLEAIKEMGKSPRKLIVASSMSIYGEGEYACPVHGIIYPQQRPWKQMLAKVWDVLCPFPNCGKTLEMLSTDEDKPLYPTSIYAVNKRDQEDMCIVIGKAYLIPTVALRYFNVYGSRQALSNPYTGVLAIFSSQILRKMSPTIFEDGKQMRDFIHVSDVVQASLMAMRQDNMNDQVFNVGTGRAITIRQVADTLLEHFGNGIEPVITEQFRSGDIRNCYADIGKLLSKGYEPKVKFEDGVGELYDWIRSL